MRFAIILLVLFGIACGRTEKKVGLLQYINGRQLLSLNGLKKNGEKWVEPDVKRISPDSLQYGQEFNARVFLDSKDIDLIAAYFDCKIGSDATVDTTLSKEGNSIRVNGCEKGLVVKNDTLYIAFRAEHIGLDSFPEITLLTRDQEKIFRTQKYAFSYRVLGN